MIYLDFVKRVNLQCPHYTHTPNGNYVNSWMCWLILCGDHVTMHSQSLWSCPTLCDPMDCGPSGSSVHGDSSAKYWSGLQCHPPGDPSDPGIETMSLMSPVLAGEIFTTCTTWEAQSQCTRVKSSPVHLIHANCQFCLTKAWKKEEKKF